MAQGQTVPDPAVPISREDLHALVDSVPEPALPAAKHVLENLQVWPAQPPVPERIARIQEEARRRATPGLPRGPGLGGGFGGNWQVGAEGEVKEGRYSSSRVEDGAVVVETHHFHRGHEITVIERLRLSEDGKTLSFSQIITGPKQEQR